MGTIIYKSKIIKFILIIILILYLSYTSIDILNIDTNLPIDNLKYISILLCFLITLISGKNGINKLDSRLLQTGMLFTVIADLFLVILDYYIPGVLVFSIVQMIYIIRYTEGKSKYIIKNLIIILILIFSIYFLVNRYIFGLDLLILLGLFYGICILTSIFKSIEAGEKNIYPNINKNMIIWGMILFALCDLNVGLTKIEPFYKVASSLIWLFYLPSQVLLSLSSTNFRYSR